MAEIIFAGSGSGFLSERRRPSAILIESGDDSLLLDCGDGASRSILAAGKDPAETGGLAITHMHPDHSGGFPFFMQTLHLRKRENPFKLFLPPEALDFALELLTRSYIFPERLGFPLEVLPLEDGLKRILGEIEITPVANRHLTLHQEALARHPELEGQAFSLALELEGKRIVYSSDICDLEDLRKATSGGGELLICEAMHIEPGELEKAVPAGSFNRVVFTHIPDEREGPLRRRGDYLWAVDGLRLVV